MKLTLNFFDAAIDDYRALSAETMEQYTAAEQAGFEDGSIYYVMSEATKEEYAAAEEAGFGQWTYTVADSQWGTKDPKLANYFISNAEADTRAVLEKSLAKLREVKPNEWPLLTPPGSRASESVATITYYKCLSPDQWRIDLKFAVKDETFRLLVRSLGFTWAPDCKIWRRFITVTKCGLPTDRLAETAHALLEAGFLVRIESKEGNDKAMSGDFEPEQTKWIDIAEGYGAEYKRWLELTWRRDDDCYHIARSLPGSRWVNPAVLVPPDNVDAVIDFAAQYDFGITEAVHAWKKAHDDELSHGVVIHLKPRPKKEAPTRDFKPRKLAIVGGSIHADLRDDD